MLQLFTVQFNHEKISVTVLLHNLFHWSKYMRPLAFNCTYYIIYRVVLESSSLLSLNKRIYPDEPKFLLLAYNHAANKPCGYILFYLNQNTPKELRVVMNIFDNKITVYLSVNSKKFISHHHEIEEAT